MQKRLDWEACLSKKVLATVIQTYHRRGSEGFAPSRWAILRNILEKKAILIPLDQISHVFRAI